MKLVTANKINRLWENGILAKMVAKTKVLNTPEEIEANTSAENVTGALVTKELYNNLKGFEPILDSTGKITGYKTSVGGADTVFPFSGNYTVVFRLTINTKGYWTDVSQSKSADITAKISDGKCTFSPASVATSWFLSTEYTGDKKYNENHKYIGYSITLISITKD